MNKARKKTHKTGTLKRLVRESFVLSCTALASSRIVRFFESGFASPLLNSVKQVDRFARKNITGPIFNKLGLRKNFAMPARNYIASFLSQNPIMKSIAAFRTALLNSSLRSAGVFFMTFGIYAAAIFLLKRYISSVLGAADANDLSVAAISVLVGLILAAFGEKSIISALGGGRITGPLLSECLGINNSALDRYPSTASGTAVGMSFLLGSLLGVATLFVTPARVLIVFALFAVFIAVMHIPEFGLLLSAMTFSFIPVGYSAALVGVTIASFLVKCIRLKRNFRFGTADGAVLLVLFALFISFLTSSWRISRGELYVLCFTAVYFLAKNLICSEKLIMQTFNALCSGLSIGMMLYILGEFAPLISHEHLRSAAFLLTSHKLDANMLAMLVTAIMPYAFLSFSSAGSKRAETFLIVLAIACAVITDSAAFYILLLVSFFVFVAFAYKAPAGALLGAAVVIPSVAALAYDMTSSSAVVAGSKTLYDPAISVISSASHSNFWAGLADIGGVVTAVIFAVALLLIMQRICGCSVLNGSSRATVVFGTVASSAAVIIICSFIFNPFSDLRMLALMWFILGLCGSTYKVYSKPQYVI